MLAHCAVGAVSETGKTTETFTGIVGGRVLYKVTLTKQLLILSLSFVPFQSSIARVNVDLPVASLRGGEGRRFDLSSRRFAKGGILTA